MIKKNLFINKLEINKSLRTRIYEFLKKEIAEEGLKKKSDKELADIFNSRFDENISRKTISKYREELKILSSLKRK